MKEGLSAGGLMHRYPARPRCQRNDSLGWIERAKSVETKTRRLNRMLGELETGGVYMRMPHPASAKNMAEADQRPLRIVGCPGVGQSAVEVTVHRRHAVTQRMIKE